MRLAVQGAGFAALLALGSAVAGPVQMPRPVPYWADADVAGNIRKECTIQTQLADYTQEYSRARSIEVTFVERVGADLAGRVLELEIRDAQSTGNAWVGHRKSTSVRGKLYQDGELIGSFRGRRDSMGGAFAGYKGSCSVLGRTVKALGKDIAEFLAAPALDIDLGDMK